MIEPAEHSGLMIVGQVEARGAEPLFEQLPWPVERVADCLQFLTQVLRRRPRVVVCDQDLPDGSWKDIVGVAGTLHSPPAVIVVSGAADDALRAEVSMLGGFALLAKPLDPQEAAEAIERAWNGPVKKQGAGGD